MFNELTSSTINPSLFNGYRLLAVDDSDLCTAQNPEEFNNHFSNTSNAKGYNLLHLNAMYDLCNRIYVDSIVQPGRKEDDGMEKFIISACTWTVFPNEDNSTWKRIYTKWLPTSEYELADIPCIECFYPLDHIPQREIWVPIL
ncbi:GyrI-like domain-containing protein [Vallitalea sp.]|jgi:predicted transcriptional regulator YdeE|uniref:GyrI-like domain-containing protein n=1 Tax=Vallitalea sp. TaxID=1882829 RepID=UPI0025CFAE51|nr:GyrI-like domain-containing protein [Vallitalea sp.]MCT4686855.1 GyrI-like domain-containing protein [Vallitalea sp.]